MDYQDMTAQEIGEKAGIPWKGRSKEQLIKTAEAQMPVKSDESLLTPTQQKVLRHVRSAPDDPPKPKIEEIREHLTINPMDIKKHWIKGEEYAYSWLSISLLDEGGYEGSKWIPVTRSNHSHIKESEFSLREGGIIFGGQNILGFCYRYVREAEDKQIVDDYNAKTERMTETHGEIGDTATRVDPNATGRIFQQQATNPGEEFSDDFSAPQ